MLTTNPLPARQTLLLSLTWGTFMLKTCTEIRNESVEKATPTGADFAVDFKWEHTLKVSFLQ